MSSAAGEAPHVQADPADPAFTLDSRVSLGRYRNDEQPLIGAAVAIVGPPCAAPGASTISAACVVPHAKKQRTALTGTARRFSDDCAYLVVLEPLLLGVLLEPPLPELEPMPLLLGALLELPLLLGELLLGVLLLGVLLLPPVLEPDLLKCASHSAFDTCPSPSLSTEVKLGALLELASLDAPEAPLELLPEELGEELVPEAPDDAPDDPDEPLELLPVALGEDLSVEDELELCAMDTLASANSAAAVAVVISFNFIWYFLLQ